MRALWILAAGDQSNLNRGWWMTGDGVARIVSSVATNMAGGRQDIADGCGVC